MRTSRVLERISLRRNHGKPGYTNTDIKARRYDPKIAEKYYKKAGWGKRGDDGIRVKN